MWTQPPNTCLSCSPPKILIFYYQRPHFLGLVTLVPGSSAVSRMVNIKDVREYCFHMICCLLCMLHVHLLYKKTCNWLIHSSISLCTVPHLFKKKITYLPRTLWNTLPNDKRSVWILSEKSNFLHRSTVTKEIRRRHPLPAKTPQRPWGQSPCWPPPAGAGAQVPATDPQWMRLQPKP